MPSAKQKLFAMSCILTVALVWGLMWYPLRYLKMQGISAPAASLCIYVLCMVWGGLLFWREYRQNFRPSWSLFVLLLVYGWTNFSYAWALTEGPVMRVLLLVYLSPLWTALLAAGLLKEHLTRTGMAVIPLSLLGCVIILYRPDMWERGGLLTQTYEWIALSSGMAFAVGCVLARRASHVAVSIRSACLWIGVASCSFLFLLQQGSLGQVLQLSWVGVLVIVALSVSLMATSLLSVHALTILPVSQVMSLMLVELVFAALASYWLAGETLSTQEWIGAVLIVGASLLSGHMTVPNRGSS